MSCGLLLPELLVRVPQGMAVEATRSHCRDHGTVVPQERKFRVLE